MSEVKRALSDEWPTEQNRHNCWRGNEKLRTYIVLIKGTCFGGLCGSQGWMAGWTVEELWLTVRIVLVWSGSQKTSISSYWWNRFFDFLCINQIYSIWKQLSNADDMTLCICPVRYKASLNQVEAFRCMLHDFHSICKENFPEGHFRIFRAPPFACLPFNEGFI